MSCFFGVAKVNFVSQTDFSGTKQEFGQGSLPSEIDLSSNGKTFYQPTTAFYEFLVDRTLTFRNLTRSALKDVPIVVETDKSRVFSTTPFGLLSQSNVPFCQNLFGGETGRYEPPTDSHKLKTKCDFDQNAIKLSSNMCELGGEDFYRSLVEFGRGGINHEASTRIFNGSQKSPSKAASNVGTINSSSISAGLCPFQTLIREDNRTCSGNEPGLLAHQKA